MHHATNHSHAGVHNYFWKARPARPARLARLKTEES